MDLTFDLEGVAGDEATASLLPQIRSFLPVVLRSRQLWMKITIILCCLLALSGILPLRSSAAVVSNYDIPDPRTNNFFHLLIPATHRDVNLCKTLLSAAVLNYSTPTLINWDRKYDDSSLASGGSHLAKIPGILSYLNALGPEQDDDLVLIVDGYDTWFQLRPEILLSRYYAVNARANARIASRLGSAKPFDKIKQNIIFSAQKLCWPHHADELACLAAPKSPLPDDMFGDETDLPFPDEENPQLRTRPRYMNSGLLMGPVADLRKLYVEAQSRMDDDPHDGSDQGIFSDILGVQEYQRELLRSQHLSLSQAVSQWLKSFFLGGSNLDDRDRLLKPHPAHETMDLVALPDLEGEYGLGLDYASDLSLATVFAQRDADWLFFSAPEKPSRFWHIRSPRIISLPTDLSNAKSPFWGLSPGTFGTKKDRKLWTTADSTLSEDLMPSSETTWADIPLYTHLWTGVVPVSIHHNAWQRNMKSFREKMWNQMWWNRQAKKMLRMHSLGSREPIIVEPASLGGRVWWSPVERKDGARLDNGTFVDWDGICGDYEWELFGQ